MEHNIVKNPNWKEVQSAGYFTSVAEDVNLGLSRTIQPSGQGGLKLRPSELQVHRSNRMATLPSRSIKSNINPAHF